MKTRKSNILGKQVMVEGMMAFGKLETGQHTLDFECCEDVVAEAFEGDFHVQAMRDGNVYITENEQKRRIRNRAIFREDNSSFSLGRDRRYYFYFSLPEQLLDELPHELVRQASVIAGEVLRELLGKPLIMNL
jgi:hypothetical protein